MGKKYNISEEGHQTRSECGKNNLEKWKDDNPGQGKITHGANSLTIRQKYSDRRTSEGKAIQATMDGLITDLGGASHLTTGHDILLSSIRSKLIVTMQIGKYIDNSLDIITEGGELLPVLKNSYTTYSECIRRDIQALFGIKNSHNAAQSYDKALKALSGGK